MVNIYKFQKFWSKHLENLEDNIKVTFEKKVRATQNFIKDVMTGRVDIYWCIFEANFIWLLLSKISQLETLKLLEVLVFFIIIHGWIQREREGRGCLTLTSLLFYCSTVLLFYCSTVLLFYCSTVLKVRLLSFEWNVNRSLIMWPGLIYRLACLMLKKFTTATYSILSFTQIPSLFLYALPE